MRALLIVDVQNDFMPGGALAVNEGDAIIPVINRLMEQFDLVVATKDWHPEHHVSFAPEHGKEAGEVVEIEGRRQELWPVHCVQGTPGAEFFPTLEASKIDKVFFKATDAEIDSYSAFFDNGHLRSTGLADYLREEGVDEVYVVGLATDYCVKFSVLDAVGQGFKPTVVIDGCRGIDLQVGDVEQALQMMKAVGATLISSEQLLAEK